MGPAREKMSSGKKRGKNKQTRVNSQANTKREIYTLAHICPDPEKRQEQTQKIKTNDGVHIQEKGMKRKTGGK
jgi:hypothetical protein